MFWRTTILENLCPQNLEQQNTNTLKIHITNYSNSSEAWKTINKETLNKPNALFNNYPTKLTASSNPQLILTSEK